MANTYTLIASSTVGSGGVASVTFSAIPATYTDLCLKASMRTNRASLIDPVEITFNNSGSNYSYRSIFSDTVFAPASFNGSGQSYIDAQYATGSNATADTLTNFEIYIPNYAGSSNKSTSYDSAHENNATEAYRVLMSSLWADSSAITSIKLDPSFASFVEHSSFYLYGISNS